MLFLVRFCSAICPTASLDELDALLELNGIAPRSAYARHRVASEASDGEGSLIPQDLDTQETPFVFVDLPGPDVLQKITSRAVQIAAAYELYACGRTLHEAVAALDAAPARVLDELASVRDVYPYRSAAGGGMQPRHRVQREPPATWRVSVHAFGLSLPEEAQAAVRQHVIAALALPGRVNLKESADVTFAIVVDTGRRQGVPGERTLTQTRAASPLAATAAALSTDATSVGRYDPDLPATVLPCRAGEATLGGRHASVCTPRDCVRSRMCGAVDAAPEDAFPVHRVYIGRVIPCTGRSHLSTLALRDRPLLGPTSLDPEMSVYMCNLAHAGPATLVLDPFVGTGSITVAAAKLGAVTLGTDIDARVFAGKQGRTIATNFTHYKLGVSENVRVDAHTCALRPVAFADAIVTDPPYGVRAGARKSGAPEGAVINIPDHLRASHIPRTQVYHGDELMCDLLDFAARRLTRGGRLVYLLPVPTPTVAARYVPEHACLRLVSVTVQPLTMMYSRAVVCMEKVRDYDPTCAEAYKAESVRLATAAGWFTTAFRERVGKLMDSWFDSQRGRAGTYTAALALRKPGKQTHAADEEAAAAKSVEESSSGAAAPDAAPVAASMSLRQLRHLRGVLARQEERAARLRDTDGAASVTSEPRRSTKKQRMHPQVGSGQMPFDRLELPAAAASPAPAPHESIEELT